MQTNTQMPHLRIAAQALRMHDALRQAKAAAVADGDTVECAIHDEITITVPTDSHARRILSRLARLMLPAGRRRQRRLSAQRRADMGR